MCPSKISFGWKNNEKKEKMKWILIFALVLLGACHISHYLDQSSFPQSSFEEFYEDDRREEIFVR